MRIDLKANRRRRVYRECGCIFGLCSSSKATTQNIQQQTAASEGSLAVGAGGKFIESGGVDVSGTQGARLGGTDLSSGGNITVNTADVDVLNNALDKYAELSAGFGSSLNQFLSTQSEDQDKKVATLLTAVQQGKESEDTAAQNRKIFIGLALAFIGLLAFLNWRKG